MDEMDVLDSEMAFKCFGWMTLVNYFTNDTTVQCSITTYTLYTYVHIYVYIYTVDNGQ